VGRLDELDLTQKLGRVEYEARLLAAQRRLLQLRLHLGGQMGSGELGPGLLVIFEGRDAGGKGGALKRLVEPLDPRHYRVSSFSAPNHDEKRHHFLWRFYRELPGLGGMAVFDRSWYGRVLVERIEGYATLEQWSRAYDEIVQFERTLVLEGLILVKLWLHISDAEQLERFQSRQADPLRQWKLTPEDWRNRERNREYDRAAAELFDRTDHGLAPWDLVAAENKRYARVTVLETVIARIEEGMWRWGFPVPGVDELALFEASSDT
jgi:polyphosphate kinase 2 (PPK2 family)